MTIEPLEITVRDLVSDYKDSEESGVVGYGGKLDIRPPYQRNYVYKGKQEKDVIHTLMRGFPLNVMYWFVRKDRQYEIIDGQQRTICIAKYVEGKFSIKGKDGKERYFKNWSESKQKSILNYKLMVYLCTGTDDERLDWFKTINIAGEKLSEQEIRNAVYAGPWLTDARRYFSKVNGPAYNVGKSYLKGSANRQEYLETVIKWISQGKIDDYMANNQDHPNARGLWDYFQSVIEWVEKSFPKKRKPMKGVDWGELHRQYGSLPVDPARLEAEVDRLMKDQDVEDKSGIYTYVFSREEKHLNVRKFDPRMKETAFARQDGVCPICKKTFKIEEMEGDHIKPWAEGGPTTMNNCQMLCKSCNRKKSSK